MCQRSWLIVALTLALVQTPSVRRGESWVGETVVGRRLFKEIKFSDRTADGKQIDLQMNRSTYRVVKDQDGKLRIHSPGQEGWVDKADMILVRDAVAYYTTLIPKNPDNPWYVVMRGIAAREKGDFAGAIKDFNESMRVSRDFEKSYIHRGLAWIAMKEYDKAIADFNEAMKFDPKPVTTTYFRGEALRHKRDYDKALDDFNAALRLDPKRVGVYNSRGKVWHLKKEYAKALADYDEALRLDANFDHALARKAYLLATCPDDTFRNGKKAEEMSRALCEATNWKNGWFIGVLGTAHAELGQFDEAIRWEQKGLEDTLYAYHSDGPDEPALARERLKAYAQKKPWRE